MNLSGKHLMSGRLLLTKMLPDFWRFLWCVVALIDQEHLISILTGYHIVPFCHFVILSFHFFIQLITTYVLILLGKKWLCSLSWGLKGYRILVFYYRTLLKLFNEIHYWEKLMFETPHYVSELYMKKEDLRILRENVLLVVRDYNRLVLKQYMSLHCHGWHRLLRKNRKLFESRSNIGIITASMSVNQLKALEGKLSSVQSWWAFIKHRQNSNRNYKLSDKEKANKNVLTYFVSLDQQNHCCSVIWRTWIVQGENPITGQENPSWFD